MDHVGRGDEQADLLVRRHDQRLVDLEQVMLALRLLAVNLRVRGLQIAIEAEPVIQVIVVPLPLRARNLDREVGHRGVLHREDSLGGWKRHEHQDQARNHRPDDLD